MENGEGWSKTSLDGGGSVKRAQSDSASVLISTKRKGPYMHPSERRRTGSRRKDSRIANLANTASNMHKSLASQRLLW